MVNYRFFFIAFIFFIYSFFSTIVNYDAKAKESPSNLNIVNISEVKQNRKSFKKLAKSSNVEPKNKIDKQFSFWGIGLTSILFLYLSFILFQPENNQSAEKEPSSLKVFDSVDLDDTSIINKNIETIEIEERVKTTKVPSIVKQSNLEFNFESIVNQIPEKIDEFDKIDSNLSINAKNRKSSTLETKTIVRSDFMGKITITTEKTTEIDIVSELIKDLQPTPNRLDSISGQKNLRRKAIWELGRTNDFRAVEPLVEIISEVNSLEKNLILDAITKIATQRLENINQVLLKSLKDRNAKVRKNAIEDLTNLYQSMSAITFHLSKMTLDSDKEVQQTAKLALKKFKEMSVSIPAVDLNQN